MPATKQSWSEKLDTLRAFRYLWLNWRLIGMHPTRRHSGIYAIYSTLINIFVGICFPAAMITNLFFIEGWEQIIGNLNLSITMALATGKQISIWLHRHRLLRVKQYLSQLDARCNPFQEDREHVLRAIRICHFYYVAYMFLYELVTVGFAYIGFSNRINFYSFWIPPIFKDAENNLTMSLIYQNLTVMSFFVVQNVNNDMYPQCYLAVMIGHLRALSARVGRIGKDENTADDDNLTELVCCIEDHRNVLSYFDCISPVISRTISMQFSSTAFVLCLTAINYVAFDRDFTQKLCGGFYLTAVLIEVLPCCWYVNTLIEESSQLTTAIYNCHWYNQSQEFRKTLIIFMQCSQKTNMILAAKMVPATLQTFLNIIRFSFSMYTILKD